MEIKVQIHKIKKKKTKEVVTRLLFKEVTLSKSQFLLQKNLYCVNEKISDMGIK